MKKTFLGIILLLMLSFLLVSCSEGEPPKDIQTDVTSETVLVNETTHIEENTSTKEVVLPDLPENPEDIEYGKIYAGGCVYFESIEIGDIEGRDSFLGFFGDAGNREIENYGLISRVFFGKNTLIEVELYDNGGYECEYIIKSITAFGTNHEFSEKQILAHCNQGLVLYELEDKTVFIRTYIANTEGIDAFSIWVIGADGVYHTSSGMEEDAGTAEYNCSKYRYYMGDNGELQYKRYLLKYTSDRLQLMGQVLQYCTARDEFCYETGTITFDGLIPIYNPTKVYTVGEVFDLGEIFDYVLSTFPENLKEININTLDELLEYHSTIYQRGK